MNFYLRRFGAFATIGALIRGENGGGWERKVNSLSGFYGLY